MSSAHIHSHFHPLRFNLDAVGPVWCNVRIESSGSAHEALIDHRHHAAIRVLLSALIELREPSERGSSGRREPGFTWAGAGNTYRWSFRPEAGDGARLHIDRFPDMFGRESGVRIFDARIPVSTFIRQAYHEARRMMRVVGLPTDERDGRIDFPIEDLARVRALVTGERIVVPRALRSTPLYQAWCRRMLED
jgi:hypothetical protein